LEGVNTGGVVRFSIPKVNGFDTAPASGGEAAALRLLRCNFFVVLSIGSDMGLGRPASAAAPLGCGLAGSAVRHDWCMSNV